MINVWTQNDPFTDPHDVILTSQMAVSEMVDYDHEWPLVVDVEVIQPLEVVKITITNVFRHFLFLISLFALP